MKLIVIYVGLLCVLQDKASGCPSRRRNSPPRPSPQDCVPGSWSGWSACSHYCGNAGTQTRSRGKLVNECCGGRCPYTFSDSRNCNRYACKNGGTPTYGRCYCTAGWTGTCCETDKNECLDKPCQHHCSNVPGSYTCKCYSCYTKVGTRCDLRQCRIGGQCYSYRTVNPSNQCQDCQKSLKTSWTNNNALSCSDGNMCTRNDRCVNGMCKGTPFTCRSCESCDGSGCKINPGYCVTGGKCYRHGNIRPGKPCQQCDSTYPTKWTANNSLKCSDGNVKTRNDRCVNGECRGEPFTCLSCQQHYNDACWLKSGYCVIKYNNVDKCFAANMTKPGNPCQWCDTSTSTSAWTNRNGTSCDDGEKCTKLDTCQNGQCGGTSFTCNSLCQYCDGNGCRLKTGFGYVAGKCTCKIAGKDYKHQQLNPNNECQWCDLYDNSTKASSLWTNKPAVSCNDGYACTKQDLCQNGRCVGRAYSCRSLYQYSSCIQSSVCVGDGTCRDVMRNNGTICRAAVDPCDQPERCDGVLGTCRPQNVEAIKLQDGQAALTDSSFASSITFQSTTDQLYLKLTGFSVSCGALTTKWSLLKNKDDCSLGNNPGNLSLSTNGHFLTGLSLKDSEKYKVVLQAYDIRGQSRLPVCSNPVTIDTSKPTGGWIRDGLDSADVQYQSSKAISATWGGFKTTHGIAKYEVAAYNSSGAKDIPLQPFTNVNLKASFTKTFSAIADGNNITTTVRAYTKAGLYSEISSDGVTIDTSNPTPGTVSDGPNASSDLKFANWTTTYDASWAQFTDAHTPIVEYRFGIKRKNGGLISSGLTSVGLKLAARVSGLSLASGVEYCAVVEGINAAGLSTQATSNCLLIDHDAPRPGTVNDGISEDIDHQSGDKTFHANWNGFDDGKRGSGLAEYKYKLTDKNRREIIPWTSLGLQTNANITGIQLMNGNTYYITVRAIDNVGHYKDVKSDGVSIDTSHPVYTGTISVQGEMAQKDGENVVYIRSNDSIAVSWPQFVDVHSGMKKYQWNIVEKNVQPTIWKDVPGINLATKAVLRSLWLTNNKEYRLTIRGINNAGLYAEIKSPLLIPLSAAPGLGFVSDGDNSSTDIDYQTNNSEVHASWKDFDTSTIKIRAYFFAVGSCMKGNYHVTNNQYVPVSPPTATSFSIKGLTLLNGQRYCVKIKAENLAGVQTEPVSSDGFIVDTTPPDMKLAMVLDGSGEDDIDYQSSKAELSATWTGIQDYESGIQHFEVAVSRNRLGEPDVTSFIDVGHNMSARFSGLDLHSDVYYVIVCAINNAGLTSCSASDGVLIDPTISTHGVVHDGILEPDIRYQSSTTKMSANWERIWDLESRVERFEWAVGENYPGLVLNFVDVGLQTHVTTDKILALRHGHNYTVFLRVYNRAGGVQNVSSNGVIIDTTPPKASEIAFSSSEWRFKQDTGIYYSSTASGMYVTWKDFEERESEVWYYKWAIGTSKCGTQLQPFINIGLATSANTSKSELKFRPGKPYYVTVIAQNRAHLVSRACSSPVMFEYTPPRTGSMRVTSNTGTEKSYFRPDEDLRVSWSDFEDFESGIERYQIAVIESNTSLLNYTLSSGQSQTQISLASLPLRKTYTVSVKAVNYAELETKAYSKQFTIDDTPPVYTGSERNLPKQRFQSDSCSLKVAWKRFTDGESPVEFYEIGIGTQLSKDDVHEFTRTGLCTNFEFKGLSLRDNQLYHITVRAHNAAGLVTSLVLETVLVDETPPTGQNGSVKDGLSGNDMNYVSVNDPLSATWENIEDPESGIGMLEYCIGSTPFNCLIKPFTVTHGNKSFLCEECKIHADMKVFARIRVTNRAGLSAIFTSNGIFVDSSPPEIGLVLDGEKGESPDMEKVDPNWLPSVTWYGAQDVQSGLKECRWVIERHDGNKKVIIYEKALGKAKMTFKVRHTELTAAPLQLVSNASYFNVIRCSNNAGISSYQYSNGFSTVDEWPLTSHVSDGTGSRDLEYDVIGESIGASWRPFYADSKDPVIGYEWALGTLRTPDDLLDFTEVRLDTRASLALSGSELELEPGVRYYVTVRATTLSGRTSNKSSNGFIIDRTPPSAGVVKVTHKIVNQKTNEVDYMLTWNGFDDTETGIRSHEYCLGYIKDVCSTLLTNAGLDLQATVQHFIPADLGVPFYGIVIATNNAGLKSIVSSKAIKLDFTLPVTGTVIDGPDEDLDYINASVPLVTKWSKFTDPDSGVKICTLTVSEENPVVHISMTTVFRQTVNASGSISHNLKLIPGLQYFSTIECENSDGFKSSASSDGVVVDESPPIAGSIFVSSNHDTDNLYQFSKNTLEAYWSPARDPESGIKEYLVAVGSGPYDVDVQELFTVGMATEVIIQNLTMNSRSIYFVTLEIVNNAGLRTRLSSYGVTVDETPPIITKVTLLSSQTAPGFVGPGDELRGNWNSYDDGSSIAFTEYCIGTTTGGCQTRDMLRLPDNQTSVTCFDCKLEHRHTYFMTIRVWNEAGLFSLASTEGVTVDLTPPMTGKVLLDQRYISCSETCSLGGTFSGFVDDESGINRCEFSIKTSGGLTVTPARATTTEKHIRANNLMLKHGESYKIAVVCINNLDERSLEVDSSPVRIDNTPPEKGVVIISPDSNHDTRRQHTGCHFMNTTLRVYWTGFHDEESHLTGFRVAIGRAPLGHDVIQYRNVNIDSEVNFVLSERYGLTRGDTIFATVEATNGAGLTTQVSSLPTRLISDTDSNLLNERDFLCVNV